MADITEQLAERTRLLHVAEDEIDRLRARVAELEAARGEPVAWIFKSPYRLFLHFGRPRPESVPLYTAPPASTVNVDAISDDRIQSGSEAYFAECSQLGITGEQSADIYMRCMRAALRAIFNKGE